MSEKESVEVDFEALGKALTDEIFDNEGSSKEELAALIARFLQNNLFVKIRRSAP